MDVKKLVIVGEEEIGKTTLANALLGWDIFPQSTWDSYCRTEEPASRMLTETIQLTDTPGYDLWRFEVPETVNEAVSGADTVIMMFKGFYEPADVDTEPADEEDAEEIRQWLESLVKEDKLLKDLLTKAKTRDIYFVIPFSCEDGPKDREDMERDLIRAKERFASFSDHGESGFYCVDPMLALIGAIEDDPEELEQSGILPLKAALLGEKG